MNDKSVCTANSFGVSTFMLLTILSDHPIEMSWCTIFLIIHFLSLCLKRAFTRHLSVDMMEKSVDTDSTNLRLLQCHCTSNCFVVSTVMLITMVPNHPIEMSCRQIFINMNIRNRFLWIVIWIHVDIKGRYMGWAATNSRLPLQCVHSQLCLPVYSHVNRHFIRASNIN